VPGGRRASLVPASMACRSPSSLRRQVFGCFPPRLLLERLQPRLPMLVGERKTRPRGSGRSKPRLRGATTWWRSPPGSCSDACRSSREGGRWRGDRALRVTCSAQLRATRPRGLGGPPPNAGEDPRVRAGAARGERRSQGASRQHERRFRGLAEEADPHLTGPDQQRWLNELSREHDNSDRCRWQL
jgi:hypothetical protein